MIKEDSVQTQMASPALHFRILYVLDHSRRLILYKPALIQFKLEIKDSKEAWVSSSLHFKSQLEILFFFKKDWNVECNEQVLKCLVIA